MQNVCWYRKHFPRDMWSWLCLTACPSCQVPALMSLEHIHVFSHSALPLSLCKSEAAFALGGVLGGPLRDTWVSYSTLCAFSPLCFSPLNNWSPTVSATERGKSKIYCGVWVSVFPKQELSFSGIQQVRFLTGTVPEDGIAVRRALISIATSH